MKCTKTIRLEITRDPQIIFYYGIHIYFMDARFEEEKLREKNVYSLNKVQVSLHLFHCTVDCLNCGVE